MITTVYEVFFPSLLDFVVKLTLILFLRDAKKPKYGMP